MAIVSAEVRFAPQLTAWFTANPTKVLQDGELAYCSDGANAGKYKMGDGTTALSALTFYGGVSASGLTIGSTTITSGTNTRILYNNAGVVGEYLVTGTGTTAVLSTSPTFTGSITINRIYGGTGVNDSIDFFSTSGVGASGSVSHTFRGGTDGNTIILTMLNNGIIRIPNNRVIQGTDSTGTNRNLITWSSGDNITITGRPGVSDVVINPTSSGVGVYIKSNGDMGVGSASPSARCHIIKTTEQLRVGYDASNYLSATVSLSGSLTLSMTGTTPEYYINTVGSTVIGNKAALATTATDGFLYIPSCAGVPTGVPTAHAGRIPIVADSTNNKLYIYSGGAWVALN